MRAANLPICWLSVPIGSICTLFNGKVFKKTEWSSTGLPIIRIQNLNNPDASFNYYDGELEERHYIKKGDLLFAWSGTPGTSFGAHEWKGEDAALNQHIFKIVFSEKNIDKVFLRYAINQKLDELTEAASGGVGLRHITKGTFEKTEISIPPLAEQKVIASKIGALLEQVETIKICLNKAIELLRTFRHSLLVAAVSGRLTEEWRTCNKIEWPDRPVRLKELVELVYGKPLPAKVRSGEGYPVYGSNGVIGLHKEYLVEGPFVIVGRKGSSGEINWSEKNGWPIDTTYFVNLMQEASLRYVFFLLQTLGLSQLNRSTAIPGLNREDAYFQLVSIPKYEEQIEIAHRIDEYFSLADSIEKRASRILEKVNDLIHSFLAKAFRGELTSAWRGANSALISGENSAEFSIERAKFERDLIKNKFKKRRSVSQIKAGKNMRKKNIRVVDVLKRVGKPLSGQELLKEARYPSDSNTDQLERFFLDIRDALDEKTIVKIERTDDGQDWFGLMETFNGK